MLLSGRFEAMQSKTNRCLDLDEKILSFEREECLLSGEERKQMVNALNALSKHLPKEYGDD